MKKLVLKAQDSIKKVDSMMTAYEKTYLDLEVVPSEFERKCKADYMFYAMWEAVKDAIQNMESVEEECNNSEE